MATQVKRATSNMKWNWNSKSSVAAFFAAVSLAFVMVFALGFGRDNFWDGMIAGFFSVILFAVAAYVKMRGITAASNAAAERAPSNFRSGPQLNK